MDMTPFELSISENGLVVLPLSLLAQAGLDPGSVVLAIASADGRIVLRRLADAAAAELLAGRSPV